MKIKKLLLLACLVFAFCMPVSADPVVLGG